MESDFRPRFGTILACLVTVLVLCIGMFAQGAGELTGVITDPSGAVVPNVQVKLTNNSTGIVNTTVTSAAGLYRFSALPVVGSYALTIDAKGFKTLAVKGIVISVGTTVTKDVHLEVGTTSEVVNVEGGVQMVQTTESQVSDLVDQRVWQQMPLETRNQNEFINLVAGAVPNGIAGSANRGAAVNGARPGSGNFLVEGADNNDQGQGGRGQVADAEGGAITGISPEAIQEYRVITNSFSAEYGKGGGFVTDTVLKSGTNQYHGSIFEYNRNQALAANGFFSNRTVDPETGKKVQDSVIRNQFGGSFGGPIIKDKTFFYGSVELHRRRDRYATITPSLTPEFLNWVDNGGLEQWSETTLCEAYNGVACPGAFANSAKLGPIFKKLMAKGPFPLATVDKSNAAQGLFTSGLDYPVPEYGNAVVRDGYSLNENKWSLKFDHKISDKDQINASYLFDDGDEFYRYGGGDATIGPPTTVINRAQNAAIGWNHSFSPTVLNTFKVSYLRKNSQFPVTPGYENIPAVVTANDPLGVGFGNTSGYPQFFTDNMFQFQDHISWVMGKHSFKVGGEYHRIRNGSVFGSYEFGQYLPWDAESLVTDLAYGDEADLAVIGEPYYGGAYSTTASINPVTGQRPDYYRGYRSNELAAYFQDDFRLTNRLTFNYGLRWEYFGPPHNFISGMDSNFYFGNEVTPIATATSNPFYPVNNPVVAGVASGQFQQRDGDIWQKDTNNFGPRAGFAYDVFGTGKFVVRAGAGIMYDRVFNNLFENIRFNPPLFANAVLGYAGSKPFGALTYPGFYTDQFTEDFTQMYSAAKAKPSARHMSQYMVAPYYEQYHAGFQYEFHKGYVLDTEYVGTMGHKLTGIRDINTFSGRVAGIGSSARPNSTMTSDNYRSNDYNSNYHALQTTVKKSFANGLQFNSSYTWSKALDTLSDSMSARYSTQPTDVWNIKMDYGPADFDISHRFVTSLSYDIPFMKGNTWLGGWSINTILSLQSGVAVSPYDTNTDTNADGYYNDRIAYLGTGNPNSTIHFNKGIGGDTTSLAYFDTAKWADPVCAADVNDGAWCNGGWSRNALRGPGYFNTDFGVQKSFKINERAAVNFQANFFNVFNHASFSTPTADLNSPNFGRITATANGPRVTQLALRLDF